MVYQCGGPVPKKIRIAEPSIFLSAAWAYMETGVRHRITTAGIAAWLFRFGCLTEVRNEAKSRTLFWDFGIRISRFALTRACVQQWDMNRISFRRQECETHVTSVDSSHFCCCRHKRSNLNKQKYEKKRWKLAINIDVDITIYTYIYGDKRLTRTQTTFAVSCRRRATVKPETWN